MIFVGIDIGKKQHIFSIIDKQTGEILSNPFVFNNNQDGFLLLIGKLSTKQLCQITASYWHGKYRALSLCLT